MLHRGLKDLKYLLADFFMFVFSVGTKPSHRHLCSSEGALDPKPKRSFASALHLAPDCLLNTVFTWFIFTTKPNLAENLVLFTSIYINIYISQNINQWQMMAKNFLTRSAVVGSFRRVAGTE